MAGAFEHPDRGRALMAAERDVDVKNVGPLFGPLSQPCPAAVHAFKHPEHPTTPNDHRLLHDLTDARHAERFAREFGDELKFDERRRRWVYYDGQRWADGGAAAVRLAVRFARLRQRDALAITDRVAREAAVVYAIRAEGRHAIDNVLTLARNYEPMRDDGENWDAHPWLLGCPNGVINLQSGLLRPPEPADRITLSVSVPFDPTATAPRWRKFISEVFAGERELVDFAHKAVGYSLTGKTEEQIALVPFGSGSNGKSTFLETIKKTLGDYAHTMPFSTVERSQRGSIPNDVAALSGRRFVTACEVNEGSRWNEARLKALTGCDEISARFLHGEWFQFRPIAKFWFGVNHKPEVRDDSYGFWRRIRLIPFLRTFTTDKTLSDALMEEAQGILQWAVQGCLRWQDQGLGVPAVVRDATEKYREDSDPLSDFLEHACDLVPRAIVGATELYEHYRNYESARGLTDRERLSLTMFGRRMSARFPRVKTADGNCYEGIARRKMEEERKMEGFP